MSHNSHKSHGAKGKERRGEDEEQRGEDEGGRAKRVRGNPDLGARSAE